MDRTDLDKNGRTRMSGSRTRTSTSHSGRYEHIPGRIPAQQQQKISWKNNLPGNGERYIDSARLAWRELTEHELIKTQGNPAALTRMVQERYAITFDEAERQVKGFLDTHKF